MIRFLVTRGSEFAPRQLKKGRLGTGTPPCAILTYDRFLSRRAAECGVYIFSDLERLTPWELRLAAEAFGILSQDPRCRALNNPARAMSRYELLRRLHIDGINDFDVFRADEWRTPSRYPVFLRYECDHKRPFSDLLQTPEALEQALRRLPDEGIPLRGVLIVEYAAEPFAAPFFRKFNTFRVGDSVFAHHVIIENSWIVKYGMPKGTWTCPNEYRLYERAFISENRHVDLLRRVFEISGIEYGRADFGIVGDRVQIYEINTNPYLSGDEESSSEFRRATVAISNQKIVDGLKALDRHPCSGAVPLRGPLLDEWRASHKWYERAEKRP
jgi:hypothetical protein